MQFPLVSVIITTYKRADMINRALNSILNQTYKNIEIIVVDDNGLGNSFQQLTEKKLKSLIEAKEITYIPLQKNVGGSQARNFGVKSSNGDYIAFLDDDDEFLENSIEERLSVFMETSNKKLAIVASDMFLFDDTSQQYTVNSSHATYRGERLKDFLLDGNAYTPMLMFERSAFEDVGGFSQTVKFQDHILVLKILGAGYHAEHVKKELYVQHIHENERVSDWKNYIAGWETRELYEKRFSECLTSWEYKRVKCKWIMYKILRSREAGQFFTGIGFYAKLLKNYRYTTARSLIKYFLIFIFGINFYTKLKKF